MPRWYFFADQCRHCLEPPCKAMAESLGSKAITQDEAMGAVLYSPKVKVKAEDAKSIREACPWDIPRWNGKAGTLAKCTLCIDRISILILTLFHFYNLIKSLLDTAL